MLLGRRARGTRLIHGRFAAISVRASFLAGLWVGLILGVVMGAILGALLVWFAGTVLSWQRDLGFTLGITRALLPFGDQIAALRWISATWWAVVPAGALAFGLLGAAVAGSIGATTLSGIITEGMIRVDHMTRGVAFIYGAVIAGAKLYPKLVKESFNNKREAVQALQKCFG